MGRPIVAGNWKMHGSQVMAASLLGSLTDAAKAIQHIDIIVFPAFVHIPLAQQLLKNSAIAWGAQNVNDHGEGAYTGEISCRMLKEFGCQYVLVGHSERRHGYGESDDLVAAKYMAAVEAGLTPILCVGETREQHEAGLAIEVVGQQVLKVLGVLGDIEQLAQGIIAYEPVWAIGTGLTATPKHAQVIHKTIRQRLAEVDETVAGQCSILYGGSIKAENAKDLFAEPDIDGGLVGGASLKAEDFIAICEALEGEKCNL